MDIALAQGRQNVIRPNTCAMRASVAAAANAPYGEVGWTALSIRPKIAGAREVGDGIREIHVIQDVVGVCAQGQPEPLVQAEGLLRAEVGVEVSGPAEGVAGDGSEAGDSGSARELRGGEARRVDARTAAVQANG